MDSGDRLQAPNEIAMAYEDKPKNIGPVWESTYSFKRYTDRDWYAFEKELEPYKINGKFTGQSEMNWLIDKKAINNHGAIILDCVLEDGRIKSYAYPSTYTKLTDKISDYGSWIGWKQRGEEEKFKQLDKTVVGHIKS